MEKNLFYNDCIMVSSFVDYSKRIMRYEGFRHGSLKSVFKIEYSGYCTKNVAEFIAIAHAIHYCKKQRLKIPIYSNNTAAISWITKRKVKSALIETTENSKLFSKFEKIQKWIKGIEFSNPILHWNTKDWGNICSCIKYCESL